MRVKFCFEIASDYIENCKKNLMGFTFCPTLNIYRVVQKTDTLCFVCLNFIKYWPIFKLISLSESAEHLE